MIFPLCTLQEKAIVGASSVITSLRMDLRFKLYNQENPGRLPRHHHHRRAGGRQQRARDHDRRHQEADPDGAVPAAAVRQGELLLLRGGGRGARLLDPSRTRPQYKFGMSQASATDLQYCMIYGIIVNTSVKEGCSNNIL